MFKGQTTKRYSDLLLQNNTVYVCAPQNSTHKFQPLDINVNIVAKCFLKSHFKTWYSDEITKQMNEGKRVYELDVDTRLSRMKPIHAHCIIGLYDKLRSLEALIQRGFQAFTITEVVEPEKDFRGERPISPFDLVSYNL